MIVDEDGAKSLTVPKAVAKLAEMAADHGWRYELTFAPGPPPSVVLRIRCDARAVRAYGLWLLEDDRVKWRGGATADFRHLRTLSQLKTLIAAPYVDLEAAA